MKIRLWATIVILAVALLAGAGCKSSTSGGMSAGTVKAVLQSVVTTFELAMLELAPKWDSTKFAADASDIINKWQVGTSWQKNIVGLLPTLSADAATAIPQCNDSQKCKNLVAILTNGINSVVADLNGQLSKARYKSKAEYAEDWNAEAPVGAGLQ